MVALADWYILPILLQLEKLSGPTIRAVLRLVESSDTSSTSVTWAEYRIHAGGMRVPLQPVRVVPSIRSYYQTIMDGSSIQDPITKLHAVGQKRLYTDILIRV